MINAQEARKKTEKANTLTGKEQWKLIENSIENDISQGFTYYYGKLQDIIINELKSLGYEIEYVPTDEGNITVISW